jgi:hypothetical protein
MYKKHVHYKEHIAIFLPIRGTVWVPSAPEKAARASEKVGISFINAK